MRNRLRKNLALCLILVMCIPAFSGMNVSGEKGNNEASTVMELPDLENWHYKIPIIVDTGDYNRTDCVLSQTINITREIGGFGTFDNNSIRVIETAEDSTPEYEVISQIRWLSTDNLDVEWIMNATTPANTQKYYSIYFDILENGAKNATTYNEYVATKENSQHIWVYGNDYEIRIDKKRGGSRVVKIDDVPRKGYSLDNDWMSWYTEHINWGIKGATTTLVEDGLIYKTVKIVSSDNTQRIYWYFYPDRMRIVTEGEYDSVCFDTIADELLNKKGTIVWNDYLLIENFTKDYQEYSQRCNFFYILDPELNSANDDVKGRSGFWADTTDGRNQTVINAGAKGTRWVLDGSEAWFGFAKNDIIRDVVLSSQNPPIITREYTWVVLESPIIDDEKMFENQVVIIKGDLTVKNTGTLVSIGSSLIVHGNITVEENGELYIVRSREYLPSEPPGKPPVLPPLPPIPPRPPIRPPIRSVAVAGNISVNGKLFIAKDSLNIGGENDGMNGIYINSTSSFQCYDATITSFSGELPVGITNQKVCYEKSYYNFSIYGNAQIDGSKISYLYDGVRILNGSDAVIQNSHISDSAGNGIFIEGNCTPVIKDNIIRDCSNAGIFINVTQNSQNKKRVKKESNPSNLAKSNDIWEVKTDMDVLPESDGWTLNSNTEGDSWSSVSNDILTIYTAPAEYLYYDRVPTYATDDATVEFRYRMIQTNTWVVEFIFSRGDPINKEVRLRFNANNVKLLCAEGSKEVAVDPTVFHTYRITFTQAETKLYIDGELKASGTPMAPGASYFWESGDRILFGDLYGGANVVGEAEWDYLYYTTEGAFAPAGVNQPLAKVDTYQKTGKVNKNVGFKGNGTDSDGTIVKYEWDFDGDGVYDWNSSTTASTTHAYATPGTYFPVLRVTDDKGATDIDYLRVNVWDPSEELTLYRNEIICCGGGIHIEESGNIIGCMIYNNRDYGIYCDESSPTIKDSCVFWNKNYDIYISQNSEPIMINASYNRTKVYLGDTTNTDGDNWTDYQELYVYGFDPYINDSDKESNTSNFDGDGFTNIEEGNVYGTDALNPDTDGNGIKDSDEVKEEVTRYAVDMGDKGYLFFRDYPSDYAGIYTIRTFTYHTSPFNPDTDLDGQNDSADLVPLDYDMDGDGKINYPSNIANPSTVFPERLAIAANNDPNLERDVDGDFVGDDDIDDDETSLTDDWVWDLDVDADGMPDKYEIKYGCTTESLNPDADGEFVWNQVGGNGWQNPWIYNARYAVLIGGGSTDPVHNFPAFKNDLIEMYDKLSNNYNYLDENIYCLLWDSNAGDLDGSVDGPATWLGSSENEEHSMIVQAIKEIGGKITKNDFFTFVEICHGGTNAISVLDGDKWADGITAGLIMEIDSPDPTKLDLNDYLDPYLNTRYARSMFVLWSCSCGDATHQLHGENRIVITAGGYGESVYTELGSDDEHMAFMHEGHYRYWYIAWWVDEYYSGFTPNLGTNSAPATVLHAFNKGYYAASHNYQKDGWDGRSYPLLEDNNDGAGNEAGFLSDTDPLADGYLAAHTYL